MKRKKIWTIYKHTLLLDGPEKGWSYIGQTCNPIEIRWKNGAAYKSQPKFYKAIKLYGWNNFKHEILIAGIATQKEADELEKFYIKQFHTYTLDPQCMGWNATKGGTGLKNLEYCDSSKAVVCFELDKSWTSIVEAAEELQLNPNGICMCCKKHRKTAYGFHWAYTDDLDAIDKLNIYKNKIKVPDQAKAVICIETGKIYSSLNKAAMATNIKTGGCSICNCCLKKRKTAGGYHWAYAYDTKQIEALSKFKNAECKCHKNKRKVRCIETGEVFDTLIEACLKYSWGIKDCLRGRSTMACGLHWEYAN